MKKWEQVFGGSSTFCGYCKSLHGSSGRWRNCWTNCSLAHCSGFAQLQGTLNYNRKCPLAENCSWKCSHCSCSCWWTQTIYCCSALAWTLAWDLWYLLWIPFRAHRKVWIFSFRALRSFRNYHWECWRLRNWRHCQGLNCVSLLHRRLR